MRSASWPMPCPGGQGTVVLMRWAWSPNGGGTTPVAISTRRSRGSPHQGCRHGGRPVGKYQRQQHISAMWPMIREPGSAHHGTKNRPRTSTSARDTTRPPGPARSRASGRSVMKRTRIRRPRVRSKRPWLEALSPDPRDPTSSGPRHSRGPYVPARRREMSAWSRARTAGRPDGDPCGQNGQQRAGVYVGMRSAHQEGSAGTATGPLRWVSSPDSGCLRSAVISLVWL